MDSYFYKSEDLGKTEGQVVYRNVHALHTNGYYAFVSLYSSPNSSHLTLKATNNLEDWFDVHTPTKSDYDNSHYFIMYTSGKHFFYFFIFLFFIFYFLFFIFYFLFFIFILFLLFYYFFIFYFLFYFQVVQLFLQSDMKMKKRKISAMYFLFLYFIFFLFLNYYFLNFLFFIFFFKQVYVSNSIHNDFILSIADVYCDDNEIDFRKLYHGIYIANVATDKSEQQNFYFLFLFFILFFIFIFIFIFYFIFYFYFLFLKKRCFSFGNKNIF